MLLRRSRALPRCAAAWLLALCTVACIEERAEDSADHDRARAVGVAIEPLTTPPALCYNSAGSQPNAPWPTVGLCPSQRRQSPVTGAQSNVKPNGWTNGFSLQGAARGGGVAIAADGTIYAGTSGATESSGRISAITPGGGIKWYVTPGPGSGSALAIGTNGTVYVATSGAESYMRALDPANGNAKWSSSTALNGSVSSGLVMSPDGATVYATTRNGRLVAVNASTGAVRWTFVRGPIWGAPAIGADGTIYLGTDNGLFAVNPTTHAEVWNVSFGATAYIRTTPAVGTDGTIYVTADDGKLRAVNPDKTIKWTFTQPGLGIIRSSPAIAADGTIYFGAQDKKVYAVNPAGTLKWTYLTGGNVDSTPAIGADGTVYIGSDDFKLYALRASGTLLFSATTGNFVRSTIGIGRNGTVYAGSDDQKLWAFGPGLCGPTDTTCDGRDDNCNGSVDEAFGAQPTSCGKGVCARAGSTSCLNGTVQDSCSPGAATGSDNDCNGMDENCDGNADENYASTPISCGVGACVTLTSTRCISGAAQSSCTPRLALSSTDLTCDGVDDNCDGTIDESCNPATSPGPNLILNGNFDVDLTQVDTLKTPTVGEPESAPEMLVRDTADTANGSAGALHIRIVKTPGYSYATHNAGIILRTSELIPGDTTLQFTFWAKSISGGKIISFTRQWGDYPTRARISTVWQPYQIYLRTTQAGSNAFLVNLAPADDDQLQTVEDGEFMLDEVAIRKLPDPPRTCGSAQAQACSPSCVPPGCAPAGLDAVSRSPVASYSLAARLRSAYDDAGLRVRRGSDNAELNIGYTLDHKLDFSALANFCGASDCYLAVLYDQSGNGRDLRQVRHSLQPKLYSGSTHALSGGHETLSLPADQAGPFLRRSGGLGLSGNPGLTVSLNARYFNAGASHGVGTGTEMLTPGGPYMMNANVAVGAFYFGDGAMSWPIDGADGLKRFVFQAASGGARDSSKFYFNGAGLGASSQTSGSLTPAPTFGAGDLIRFYTDPATWLETLVVWDAMLAQADLSLIDTAAVGTSSGGSDIAGLSAQQRDAYIAYEASGSKPGSLGRLVSAQASFAQFEQGCIYTFSEIGTHVVYGPLCEKYQSLGAEHSVLGRPVADSVKDPNGADSMSAFEFGVVYYSPAFGAHELHAAVYSKWRDLVLANHAIGAPISDVQSGDGQELYANFEDGCVEALPNADAHLLANPICVKYRALSASQRIALGAPADDTRDAANGGLFSRFTTGAIYWSAASLAHELHGAIWDEYTQLGYETSELGYPVTDELSTGDGWARFQYFEHGRMTWSPSGGAHSITHEAVQIWEDLGGAAGKLGAALEEPGAQGDQHFEGGAIYTSAAGTFAVYSPIWPEYRSLGDFDRSLMGMPINAQLTDTDGQLRQDFEHGTIKYDATKLAGFTDYYDDQPMKGATSCTAPTACNPCVNNVQAQFAAIMANPGRFDQVTATASFFNDPYPPSGILPVDAYSTDWVGGGVIPIDEGHVQSFLRLNNDRYAFTFNAQLNDGSTLGTITFLDAAGTGIGSIVRPDVDHPGGLFAIGNWAGVIIARTPAGERSPDRIIQFYDINNPGAPIEHILPAGDSDAQPGQGASMTLLRGGGYLLMVATGHKLYWTHIRGLHEAFPPYEEGNDRYIDYSSLDGFSSTEHDWQNVALITECGTGDIYAIQSAGDDDVNIWPVESAGDGYWHIAQLMIQGQSPYLRGLSAGTVPQDSSHCWPRGGANASSDSSGTLHLSCSERDPEENGVVLDPNGDEPTSQLYYTFDYTDVTP